MGGVTLESKIRTRINEIKEAVESGKDMPGPAGQDAYEWGIIDGLEEALIIIEDEER